MNHRGETARARGDRAADDRARQQRAARAPGIHGAASPTSRPSTPTLVRALPRGGVAVLNADDAHVDVWRAAARERAGARVVDVRARMRRPTSRAHATLRADGSDARARDARRRRARVARACRARTWRATRSPRRPRRSPSALRSPRSRAGSRRFVPVAGTARRAARDCAARSCIDDTYNANPGFGARGDRRARRGARRRAGSCWATWARSARSGPAFHREIGEYARERGIDAAVRARRRWRAKPSRRSARVRRHFDVGRRARRAARRCDAQAGRDAARQGLALHAHGARRRGADRSTRRKGRTDAAAGSPSCWRSTCARSTCSATSRCARCWRR